MKRLLIAVNCVLFTLFYVFVGSYSKIYILPNSYLGNLNLSAKTFAEGRTQIGQAVRNPIRIVARDRVYNVTLSEMGIIVDDKAVDSYLRNYNKTGFPLNGYFFIRSLFVKSYISPPLIYTQDYYRYLDDFVLDFSAERDLVVLNESSKQLTYFDNEEKFKIDAENFKLSLNKMFTTNVMEVKPKLIASGNVLGTVVSEINEKIERMFALPLKLFIEKDGKFVEYLLTDHQLRRLASVEFDKDSLNARPVIDEKSFFLLKEQINSEFKDDGEKKISFEKLKVDLLSVFYSRFDGGKSDTILAKFDYHPNSTGNLASKYIEVDLSQQKMYLFNNKILVNSYRISTGKFYRTPVGKFKILNKAENAYSAIYDVYMPFWMAFSYATDIGAYLGIHELPYHLTIDGQAIRRPRENIGSPNTGGCIALDIGKAWQVYEFADVGTEIFIFD